jgi:hypothetical protein
MPRSHRSVPRYQLDTDHHVYKYRDDLGAWWWQCACSRSCWEVHYKSVGALLRHQTRGGPCLVDPSFRPPVHVSTVFVHTTEPPAASLDFQDVAAAEPGCSHDPSPLHVSTTADIPNLAEDSDVPLAPLSPRQEGVRRHGRQTIDVQDHPARSSFSADHPQSEAWQACADQDSG